jgi:hypothetical protein
MGEEMRLLLITPLLILSFGCVENQKSRVDAGDQGIPDLNTRDIGTQDTGTDHGADFRRDSGIADHKPRDASVENCTAGKCKGCTLDKCRINEAGTRACCFSEPQPGYVVCCRGPTPQVETYACNPGGTKCMTFCDFCFPYKWKLGKKDAGATFD